MANKVSVKAKPSEKGNATSGKIIISTKNSEQVIDAVVFSSSQSERLLKEVDHAYEILADER